MTRLALLLGAAALLAGCTARAGDPPDPNVAPPAPPGRCDAAPVQALLGRPVSDALVEQARRASGAALARTLRPGTMVTMEYRIDRLNLTVDVLGKVTAIRCG